MKFLIAKIGYEEFDRLVKEEFIANKSKKFEIDADAWPGVELPAADAVVPAYTVKDPKKYEAWKETNTFRQKQSDYYAAYVRVPLGNISSVISRQLIEALRPVVGNDVRVTANQGLLLKFIQPAHLPYVFSALEAAGFAEPGFDSIADITACPGTDTCNLAISSSTGISTALELVISEEFPELIYNKDIKIKISGCMNSCGQHGIASIGFHGSSMKSGGKVLPALQVLLGGGIVGDGVGRVADKVIKVPSKRGPDVLRTLLKDFAANGQPTEKFNDYYDRQGERYFYDLLKPLTDLASLIDEDFIDWGQGDKFATAIGVGECASVVIDLVATLLFEGEEKLQWGKVALDDKQYADSIYHSYSTFVQTAKALLLGEGVACNTQTGVISDFDKYFVQAGKWPLEGNFKDLVLQINQNEPTEAFAKAYYKQASDFYQQAQALRQQETAASVPAE